MIDLAALGPAAVPTPAVMAGTKPPTAEPVADVAVEDASPVVIREKTHDAEPMTLDQALYEMELVGHDFYLFIDSDTNRPSVVYRRKGWDYGVIGLGDEADELAEQARRAGVYANWISVAPSRPGLEELSALVESGQLKPHVSQTFPLEGVADAHRAQETGHTVGKIVLDVA